MKYLISKCKDTIFLDSGERIEPGVKYELDHSILRLVYGDRLYIVDPDNSRLIHKIAYNHQVYYLLDIVDNEYFATSIMWQNKIMSITLSRELIIFIDGEVCHREEVKNIQYSHYEKIGDICLIFFEGERNYFIAIKKTEILYASYFDEYNEDQGDRYFMCRLYDSLNHGRVFHIGKTVENYLVYLDDQELCLKSEFVGAVFLDCILAGNYKYANILLIEDIRQNEVDTLKEFFSPFDNYYPLEENTYILMKKNTLAGIYKFELIDRSISNIIELS
ncbi:MAG: hypothetical protein IKC49_02130 [Clostridia bacterium]|nr:hypothetical protein [Clostridia bacterium]